MSGKKDQVDLYTGNICDENVSNRRSMLRNLGAVGLGALAVDTLISSKNAEAAIVSGQTITAVATVEDLRQTIFSSAPYNGQQFELLGYSIKGKGGGILYYDANDTTTVDNKVTVFVSVQGYRFKRKIGNVLTVFDAGALGNNTDESDSIQYALDAALVISFGGAEFVYKVSKTLNMRSGHTLIFNRAKIVQIASQTAIFNCDAKTGIAFYRGVFQGYASDYVDSSSSMARAISGNNVVNCVIDGCEFLDFAYSSFTGFQVNQFVFRNNICSAINVPLVVGVSRNNTGVTVGGTNIVISGNNISSTAQGLILAETSSVVVISANNIRDTRVEHGMYCDSGITCLTIIGNSLKNCYQNGIKIQWYNASGSEPHSITISDNTIDGTAIGDGILLNNTNPGSAPFRAGAVSVTGNSIRNVGQDGLSIRFVKNSTVKDNVVDGTGRAGTYISQSTNTTFSNVIANTKENGIFEDGTSANIKLTNNEIHLAGLNGNYINGASSGIFCAGSVGLIVKNNTVTGNNANMQYALYIAGGNQSTMTVTENDLSGALEYGARFSYPVSPFKIYRNNYFSGASGVGIALYAPAAN